MQMALVGMLSLIALVLVLLYGGYKLIKEGSAIGIFLGIEIGRASCRERV